MAYIKRQKEHHATGDLIPELESAFEEMEGMEIDRSQEGFQEASDKGEVPDVNLS